MAGRSGALYTPNVRLASGYKFYLAALVAVLLGACASTPPPTERIASARAMVSQAQTAAANDAPLEVHAAQLKPTRAEEATQRGEYEAARRQRNRMLLTAREREASIASEQARMAELAKLGRSRGIEPSRIDARGYGPAFPIASTETPTGRQLNRRVETSSTLPENPYGDFHGLSPW